MSNADDARNWVRRMAAGDPAAIAHLHQAFGQRLYAYALRLTANPAAAEDIVQDALLAAWKGAPSFRGDSRPLTWLLGIVHHLALKTMRYRWRWLPGQLAARLHSPLPSPEHAAGVSLLQRQIQRLPRNHRVVLDLIFYQGLSLEEAAQVCACPLGTIKSRLHHAKAALREALEDSR